MGIATKIRNVARNYREAMNTASPRRKTAWMLTKSYWNDVMRGTSKHEEVCLWFKPPWNANGGKIPFHTMSIRETFGMLENARNGLYVPSVPIAPTGKTPVIFECGSNTGVVARHYKHLYPDSEIHCFEASREIAGMLEKNVGGIQGVRVVRRAVSDKQGPGTLNQSRRGSLGTSLYRKPGMRGTEPTKLITLEEYMRANKIPRIDLLKLNVEGSELRALLGLGPQIENVGVIVGEIHETVDSGKMIEYLEKNGFRVLPLKPTTPGKYLFEALNERMHPQR